MRLAARTRWTLRRYWADRLGVSPDSFDETEASVGVTGEDGVDLFVRNGSFVIGAPSSLVGLVQQRANELAALDSEDSSSIRDWFAGLGTIDEVLGPAFYGYADRETFTPVESGARVLTIADEPAYDAFRAGISDDEWDQGGMEFEPTHTIGCFVDDTLVAIAGYDIWNDLIAHIAVVTHPDHRNDGHGRAVVSRATERALADGLIPQYRTLDAWPWSVALAQNLGFRRFATSYLGIEQ